MLQICPFNVYMLISGTFTNSFISPGTSTVPSELHTHSGGQMSSSGSGRLFEMLSSLRGHPPGHPSALEASPGHAYNSSDTLTSAINVISQVSLCSFLVYGFMRGSIKLHGGDNGTPLQENLAWKIPWTVEPGRLQSTRSLRVGDD